jgi:hypothetical protein
MFIRNSCVSVRINMLYVYRLMLYIKPGALDSHKFSENSTIVICHGINYTSLILYTAVLYNGVYRANNSRSIMYSTCLIQNESGNSTTNQSTFILEIISLTLFSIRTINNQFSLYIVEINRLNFYI